MLLAPERLAATCVLRDENRGSFEKGRPEKLLCYASGLPCCLRSGLSLAPGAMFPACSTLNPASSV